MSEKYDIGLGNNNVDLRKEAQSDFISFWDKQLIICLGLVLGSVLLIGILHLLNGL
jgi:hypothetical protein